MKKHTFIIAIELLLAALAIVFIAALATGSLDVSGLFSEDSEEYNAALGGGENIAPAARLPDISLPHIKAYLDFDAGVLKVRQDIMLTEAVGEFTGYLYARNFADVDINGISADGRLGSFSTDGFEIKLKPQSPVSRVSIEYTVRPRQGSDILAIHQNMAIFTNFLVVPAVKVGGADFKPYIWRFGDPFIYDLYDYDILVNCPDSMTAYAPGKVSESRADGRAGFIFSASDMRDFPLVIGQDLTLTEERLGDITIRYLNAYDSSAFVRHSLEYAVRNIGPYPYSELFVVKAPLNPNNGMEFSCMIMLSDRAFASVEGLKSLTYHEVFHQWFYGIIHSDQFNEPFMDEGLVTMLTYAIRHKVPEGAAYNGRFFGMKLSDYSDKAQYDALAYTAAADYFCGIYNRLGEEEFFAGLRRVYERFAFKRMSHSEFVETIG